MISELFTKYQFGAIHTAAIKDDSHESEVCSTECEIFRGLIQPILKKVKAIQPGIEHREIRTLADPFTLNLTLILPNP